MSLRSLPGPGWENLRSLTIGSDGWRLTIIVLQSLFLAGPSTDRGAVVTLRPRTNSWTLPSLGLATQIPGSERRGRKAKD